MKQCLAFSREIFYVTVVLSHLVVSEGVDERVDAAVEEDHDDSEVVEGAREVDVLVADVVHQVVRLVPRPAEHEEERHCRQGLDHVRTCAHHVVVASLQPCNNNVAFQPTRSARFIDPSCK